MEKILQSPLCIDWVEVCKRLKIFLLLLLLLNLAGFKRILLWILLNQWEDKCLSLEFDLLKFKICGANQ